MEAIAGRMSVISPESRENVRAFRHRLGNGVEFVQPRARASADAPGRWNPRNVESIEECITEALREAMATGGALVTGPVDKRFFAALGRGSLGHTEFLAELGGGEEPVILFDAPDLRVAVLTRHIPLAAVAGRVTKELLEHGTRLVTRYVAAQEGLCFEELRPVAVAGLDPHCGEWGLLAETDVEVRGWAEELSADGLRLAGPFSADTVFLPASRASHSAVLCWYHDQGMVAVKLLAFDTAVNVTLGLPVVRTSPAHGVAYDIVGRGCASWRSMSRALTLAAACAGRISGHPCADRLP